MSIQNNLTEDTLNTKEQIENIINRAKDELKPGRDESTMIYPNQIINLLAEKLLVCGVHAIEIRQSAGGDCPQFNNPKGTLGHIEEQAQKIKTVVFGEEQECVSAAQQERLTSTSTSTR